jgi:hypothetical protein
VQVNRSMVPVCSIVEITVLLAAVAVPVAVLTMGQFASGYCRSASIT